MGLHGLKLNHDQDVQLLQQPKRQFSELRNDFTTQLSERRQNCLLQRKLLFGTTQTKYLARG